MVGVKTRSWAGCKVELRPAPPPPAICPLHTSHLMSSTPPPALFPHTAPPVCPYTTSVCTYTTCFSSHHITCLSSHNLLFVTPPVLCPHHMLVLTPSVCCPHITLLFTSYHQHVVFIIPPICCPPQSTTVLLTALNRSYSSNLMSLPRFFSLCSPTFPAAPRRTGHQGPSCGTVVIVSLPPLACTGTLLLTNTLVRIEVYHVTHSTTTSIDTYTRPY